MTDRRTPRGTGSVFQTTVRGKKMWCASISWYDRDNLDSQGKPKRTFVRGFGATQAEALRARQERLVQRSNSGTLERKVRSPKLESYLTTWLNSYGPKQLSEETRRKYRRDVEQHVLPHLNKALDDLRREDLENLFNVVLPKVATESAIWNAFKTLRTLLNHAATNRVIDVSPMANLKQPHRKAKVTADDEAYINRRVNMTKSILEWLADPTSSYHDHYPRVLMMFLGLRRGEILGLEWDCIKNLNKGDECYLIVRQQLKRYEDGSGWYIYGETKNRKDRRVYLPKRWRDALKLERAKQREAVDPKFSNLIFLQPNGRHTDYNKHWDVWNAILRDYYARDNDGPIDPTYYWRPHANRHITASLLAEQNVPLHVAQDILGHSDAAMTIYYTKAAHRNRGCSRGLNPPVSRSDRAM